jgi:hypothetical protein
VQAYHVGSAVTGSYLQEKEPVKEVFEVPKAPRFTDTNISFEQGRHWCMLILFSHQVFTLSFLCLILYCALDE